MASVLHCSARTTPCLRAEFKAWKESARSLAAHYGLNPKTVKKWRNRATTSGAPMGPKTPKGMVLSPAEEATVVAFRQKTLLPLDDMRGSRKQPSAGRWQTPHCHVVAASTAGNTADTGYPGATKWVPTGVGSYLAATAKSHSASKTLHI